MYGLLPVPIDVQVHLDDISAYEPNFLSLVDISKTDR